MAEMNLLTFTPLFAEEDEETILERWREWANEGLDPAEDVDQWTDTREGSHWYVSSTPMRREAARMYDLAGTEVVASAFPQWSWGEYLDDHGELRGIGRLVGTPAGGSVIFRGSAGTLIPAGTVVGVEPADPDAEAPEYEVTAAGTILAQLPNTDPSAALQAGGSLPVGEQAWAVTAVDEQGETGWDTGATPDGEVLATTTSGNRTVNLTWPAVPNADAYRIYRWTLVNGGGYDFVAEVPAGTLSYLDDGDPAPDPARRLHDEGVNTTGGITVPVRALETGSQGNVAAGAVTALVTPLAGVTSVENPIDIVGGTEPETDQALRDRILEAYSGAAVANQAYYRRIATAYPGVGRATVIPAASGPGTVLIVVATADGQPVAPAVVTGLQTQIDPTPGKGAGTGQVGATITVSTATLLAIDVDATVEFESGYSLDGAGGTVPLRDAIEASMASYIDSVETGGEVVRQQVIGRIVAVTGVHDVANVTLNGVAGNVAVPSSPPRIPTLGDTSGIIEGNV